MTRVPRETTNRAETMALALRLLGVRNHSSEELLQKLLRKGHDQAIANIIIGELREKGLLDDRAFGRELIAAKTRKRPTGSLRLRAELRQKGLDEPLIEELLGGFSAKEACLRAAEKKFGTLRGETEKKKRTLVTFLQGRGFRWEEIRSTLETLLGGSGRADGADLQEHP